MKQTLSPRLPLWLWLLAIVPWLGYLATELYLLDGDLGFPLDDSWIHLQFARNLASGLGLSFNPGELVPGSTAPLWTALLSLAYLLPLPALPAVKLLGLLAHLASIDATHRLGRELGLSRGLCRLAAGLVAGTSWLLWSALAGMEVGCFLTLSLWGVILHLRARRKGRSGATALGILALATLARPEGALLLLLAIADRAIGFEGRTGGLVVRLRLRGVAQGLLLVATVLVPIAGLYLVLTGSPLPTTFTTKAGYGQSGLPRAQFLHLVQGIFFQPQPIATLLMPAGVVALLSRLGSDRDRGLLPALWVVGLPLAYGALSSGQALVGNFGRYFFVLFPFVVLLGAVGWDSLAGSLPSRLELGRVRVVWAPIAAVVVLAPTLSALVAGAGLYGRSVLNVEQSDLRMARFLEPRLDPDAVLAVNDIGAIKYHLPNRVVDLAGIVTPEVHAYARRALTESGDYRPGLIEYVRQVEPDYVVVFPSWFGAALDTPELVPLLRLEIPDNITMGGDELVLYATPWTRYPLREPEPRGDRP